MTDKKFNENEYEKLDSPKRRKILPVDNILQGLGEINPGMVVADIGCGIGYLTLPLAERLRFSAGKVFAIDISPKMLNILESKIDRQQNIELVKSKESEVPIKSKQVDLSFLVTVFHELEEPEELIDEIKRFSKNKHRVVIVDWNDKERDMGPPAKIAFSKEEVIDIFKDKGYELLNTFKEDDNFYGLVFNIK
ncbi:class I SAM-dependent methyltransferase [Selenihalanaerobacter shriftii]|uniref:Methyltransferase domain-containing protein n=1 Tax=Selenihalanaerobacter shriftii TaxID=142842 RepID=A0A1T4LA77_9FIRM|nr:class I SAM-dependent methyltransferase [Selenihalanaerobacter shriftii]SJZ51596.1 Methyltransferase domain-containing protein [Selenihalanaerobacter shriftii]